MDRFVKKYVKSICWYLYGKTIRNPPLPYKVKSILFICKGNICRSPFAEYIFSRKYNSFNRYLLYSAGINVTNPKSPPENAIITARKFGVDLQDHKSRSIKYSLVESNDIIVATDTWQYNYLRKIFLEYRNKIFLLPLFDFNINSNFDCYYSYNIKDPYGANAIEFEECYTKIERCLEGLFIKLIFNNFCE